MGRSLRSRYVVQWTLVALVSLGLGWGAMLVRESFRELDLADRLQVERDAALLEANAIRYRLEAETLSSFYLVTGLATYIRTNPEMNAVEFERFAKAVFDAKPGLVNIAVAPDMVIRFVYPMEGNEAALGLDYTTHPTQRAAAMAVKEKGRPVIAGPLELVQGGVAVVGRFPVYSDSGFWGIVSTPVYLKQLLLAAGLLDDDLPVEVSLRGRDGKGADGEVFFGDARLFDAGALTVPVQLFSGSWELGVRPVGGWTVAPPHGLLIDQLVWLVLGLLVVVVVLLNVYVLRLVKSREEEAKLSRAKSRFLAMISHEIRTPLNGICGITQLLEMGDLDEEQAELVRTLATSASALNDLLTDILELVGLELGVFRIKAVEVDLEECLSPMLRLIEMETRKKRLAFRFDGFPLDHRVVEVDPLALRQILWNLLSNAVKFTAAGEVRLKLEVAKAAKEGATVLRIEVFDTGVGIAKSRQQVIFDDFVQEDDSTTRAFGGTGLGLAIVRRFVNGLNGQVSVESEKGMGCLFRVELPVVCANEAGSRVSGE